MQELVDGVTLERLTRQPTHRFQLDHLPLGLLVGIVERQKRQRQNRRPHVAVLQPTAKLRQPFLITYQPHTRGPSRAPFSSVYKDSDSITIQYNT